MYRYGDRVGLGEALFDAASMGEADRRTIEILGIPGAALMETAGHRAAEALLAAFPEARGGVTILCGKGNNGGDGFVIGRYLTSWGIDCAALRLFPRTGARGDAALHMRAAEEAGLPIVDVADEGALKKAIDTHFHGRVLVDALLGTGLSSPVRGLYRAAIEAMNASGQPIFAVDLPSGVSAGTGEILGTAPRAGATATFGGLKAGMTLPPGRGHCGDITVVDIGFSPSLLRDLPVGRRLTRAAAAEMLPPRPRDGHKGTFGHLLVVAGSRGKAGAAALTALAALRSGAGLVTLALPAGALQGAAPLPLEVMVETLGEGDGEGFTAADLPRLRALAEGKSALALGPGMGQTPGARALVRALAALSLPKVIDADGLNALAESGGWRGIGQSAVLTPHPGEAGRLLGCPTSEIVADRLRAAREIAKDSGGVALIKGEGTIIADPSGFVDINPTGNPGMGTGGAGDALTGLIGGLLAQGCEGRAAASAGAYLHGLAGDLAAARRGGRALIATDIIDAFGAAFQAVLGEDA